MPTPDRYAVVGNPVEHSRSPFIHARFAEQTGQALSYDRVLCPLDGFATGVRAFAAHVQADGSRARGCNVTVPFKFEAYALATRRSARAELAQAANTLCFDAAADATGTTAAAPGGGWFADNTDGVGLMRDITQHAGVALGGRRVLLIGAGGASAGVLGALLLESPAQVMVANRTPDKAQALVARHLAAAQTAQVDLGAATLGNCGTAYDVVINGTASSLSGDGVPVSAQVLKPGCLAVDMMYGPSAAGFLQWAAEHNAAGRDGLGMLVEQAAEAFFVWRGVRPDSHSVLAELRSLISPS